jgi:thiol-disulfide isomerase/thioredoxin
MARLPLASTLLVALGALAAVASLDPLAESRASADKPQMAPELPRLPASAWLNSPPLTLAQLRGRPVLIEFWTFECANCRNTLAWMKHTQAQYGPKGLAIVAVHSPELEEERDPVAIARAVRTLGITYPVLLDNEFHYWKALGNRFWPAFYLLDPAGRIVATRIGELHRGDESADEFERSIAAFLTRL